LEEKTFKETLRSLYDITLELNLQTISVSKTDVDNVSWAIIEKFLRELFYDSSTKIIVCDNYVTIPETSDRIQIIAENHASAIGGHKSITETYKRIIIISGQVWNWKYKSIYKNAEITSWKN